MTEKKGFSLVERIEKTDFKRPFLGLETSGKLHLGHYLILSNLKKFSKENNCIPTVYLADFHAKLNDKKNVDYYTKKTEIFMNLFFENKVDLKTSTKTLADLNYTLLFNEYLQKVNLREVLKSLPEDLQLKAKKEEEKGSLKIKYLIYSVYQAIDPLYFNIDTVFCGRDQRRVYAFAYDIYQKLGWPKFNLILYPLVNKRFKIGEYSEKMSSSDEGSIFLDQSLFTLLQKNKNKSELTVEESKKLEILKKNTDSSCLELYGVKDNDSFLDKLYEDCKNLKDFTW